MKRAALHNLGCKVNAYEMDAMEQLLRDNGYEIVSFEELADVYIINTCTVTNIADRKSRQMLHRAKKRNPDGIVIAVGCYVQTDLEGTLSDAGIDLCIGNNKKKEIVTILSEYLKLRQEKTPDKTMRNTSVIDINKTNEYEELQLHHTTAEHTRAYIKIQDGCNQFCTYCIIPYARGRVRSRTQENIITEIQTLSENGYREFVITGIHISSYGSDFENPGQTVSADCFYDQYLLQLLQSIDRIAGVARIRLGSLEPRIITDEFALQLSKIKKLCPHFHLSLQSGCDAVLQRMNRRYTAEEFYEKTLILRKYFTHPAITTDVITGFPGETEEEFMETEEFLKKVSFYEMHIFKYSKRRNTPAAARKDQLTEAVKASRSEVYLTLEKQMSADFRRYYIAKTCEVLLEECKEINSTEYWVGYTKEYVRVVIPKVQFSDENMSNQIVTAFISGILENEYMLGSKAGN